MVLKLGRFGQQIKNLFTSKLDLNLRKKLIKCHIWSMALYGAENWTLRAADQKFFYQQIGLKFEEETSKMLIWSMALCGVETWTFRAADQK